MTLQYFPAPHPNKTGILICPGGGYEYISIENEGTSPAKWLNDRGFDAWILSYTCVSAERSETPISSRCKPIYPAPQTEALNAINEIRAKYVGTRLTKLGIWGFSAGGHLAAITATTPGLKLDFAILAYPVISMDYSITHYGSRTNLLGDDEEASAELVWAMSAQNRVSAETPPTFLFHTANDATVSVKNSLVFAAKLAEFDHKFKLLVLEDGPHGVGLAEGVKELTWTGELERWFVGLSL